jgi:hypothetical protein
MGFLEDFDRDDEAENLDQNPVTLEDLEQKALDKARMREREAKNIRQTLENASILQKIQGVMRYVSDKYTEVTLPEGVNMELYRFICQMYSDMVVYAIRGQLVMGGNWVRFGKTLSNPRLGAFEWMDAKYDVLDFLMDNYLPDEIIKDEFKYRMTRYFFVREFDLGSV